MKIIETILKKPAGTEGRVCDKAVADTDLIVFCKLWDKLAGEMWKGLEFWTKRKFWMLYVDSLGHFHRSPEKQDAAKRDAWGSKGKKSPLHFGMGMLSCLLQGWRDIGLLSAEAGVGGLLKWNWMHFALRYHKLRDQWWSVRCPPWAPKLKYLVPS